MTNRLQALVLICLVFAGLAFPIGAQQTAQNASRDGLVTDIQAYAERHVKNKVPMQTQLVVNLFKDNTVGLTPREIAELYEKEYTRLKKAGQSPRKKLLPNLGWIAAMLTILGTALRKHIAKLIEAVGAVIYNRLAGIRLFRRIALRKYRKALIDKYGELKIIFRPNRPLPMREVYVPLKVKGTADSDLIDAYKAITDYPRLMVTGPPGSGKSMLMKHLALSYAEGRLADLKDQPIPVLLELHRLNNPSVSLEQQLVAAFKRHNFPRAERLVSLSLKQGRLFLLLDGIDEVNSSERERVVSQIKNLLDEYRKCRAVITCRTAVYNSEFADYADQTLEIVEFTDQQIWEFLHSWERDMPEKKSIEQLMQTLGNRPRIMVLARNPMLLTIIAYLYTDTEFVLPYSRAEFYDKSIDLLLRQWKQERNQFDAPAKRAVLRHLARFNQERALKQNQDRRSIDYQTALEQVRQLLPSLNLQPDQDAVPLLDEIVERSGLLLKIDAGERYQFAHLTLQEFFVAEGLIGDEKGLISRFKANLDDWSEPIKLWCGLAENSTTLIEAIYVTAPYTTFECLADAKRVERSVADKILEDFKSRFTTNEAGDTRIAIAFGAVASDMRPRGAAVFEFLVDMLVNDDSMHCKAAADALSRTNLPQAAIAIAEVATSNPEIVEEMGEALVRMGDLAVDVLEKKVTEGVGETLNLLEAIDTPKAISALVNLLFLDQENVAGVAAWRVASWLRDIEFEERLSKVQFTEAQKKKEYLDWIWVPFGKEGSGINIIVGRVAHLLAVVPRPESALHDAHEPDRRLVVPLLMIHEDSKTRSGWRRVLFDAAGEDSRTIVGRMRDLVFDDVWNEGTGPIWATRFDIISSPLPTGYRNTLKRVHQEQSGRRVFNITSTRWLGWVERQFWVLVDLKRTVQNKNAEFNKFSRITYVLRIYKDWLKTALLEIILS